MKYAKGHNKAHPGFKAESAAVEKKEGAGEERAKAILASAGRNTPPAAKRANPLLDRIKK